MEKEENHPNSNFWSVKSVRLYVSLLFFFVVLATGLVKNTLSMAMVCMVNSTVQMDNYNDTFLSISKNISTLDSECPRASSSKNEYHGEFNWGQYEQGVLFSTFFAGGLITPLPAGWLADRYDPKLLITIATLLSTLGCCLTPVTTKLGGFVGLAVLRFMLGIFGQALLFPGISAMMARWIPPTERSTVSAIYTVGNQMANVIGMPLNAVLCGSNFLGGWPAIFYVNALFGGIALILWHIFVSNRPESNRFISDKEKAFISERLINQNLGNRKTATKNIPWKRLLLSPAVLVCLVAYFALGIMQTLLPSYIPTYFKDVLRIGLINNGLLSALPYVFQTVGKLIFGIIGDMLKKRTQLSHTLMVKVFNSISYFGVAVFLVACSYMNCSTAGWAATFLCLANLAFAANVSGIQTSIVSIAPAYSGIIMSLNWFVLQIASVIAPLIVAGLTPNQTAEEWQHVFFCVAGIMSSCGILFLIFGSASIQEWAKLPENV